MKVLVIGGTGVIGEGVVPELRAKGCSVRLLSRRAEEHAREWPDDVEAFPADIDDPGQLANAAAGCDVAVHITGIIEEAPPEITFERINVDGVRHTLAAAERASVRRFVYISSLGADRGTSPYHRSKRDAETLVRSFPGEWVIVRPGNVYGPGDEVISKLLRLVRGSRVIPLIDRGTQRFQPIWYRDLGQAIARTVDMPGIAGQTLEVAGTELTSGNDLLDRFAEITGTHPFRVPIPSLLVSGAVRVAEAVGIRLPISGSTLTMLLEENVVRPPAVNALVETFGITPTPLADGLRLLADTTVEQLPTEGVGSLDRKRFWADIERSRYSSVDLMELLRAKITEVIPIEFDAEPGTPQVVERGVTLTAALPMRGTIQMRVEEVTPNAFTFATLKGHPLAGVVRFSAEGSGTSFRFLVTVYARAAGSFDWLAMQTVGKAAQRSNWEEVIEKAIRFSGGSAAEGVRSETTPLDEAQTAETEAWIVDLVTHRKREERREA